MSQEPQDDVPLCSWCSSSYRSPVCLEVSTCVVDDAPYCDRHGKQVIERRARLNRGLVNQVQLGHVAEETLLQGLLISEKAIIGELAHFERVLDDPWFKAEIETALAELDKTLQWISHMKANRLAAPERVPVLDQKLSAIRQQIKDERSRLLRNAQARAAAKDGVGRTPKAPSVVRPLSQQQQQSLQMLMSLGHDEARAREILGLGSSPTTTNH